MREQLAQRLEALRKEFAAGQARAAEQVMRMPAHTLTQVQWRTVV